MKIKLSLPKLSLAVAVGLPTSAFAQIIGYTPAVDATVPTLSQWGMLILAVLLAIAAIYTGRKQANRLWSVMLAAAALGFGAQGMPVGDVQASPLLVMANNTGGTVDVSELGGLPINVPINGNPTIPMRIISVTPASVATAGSPTCAVGLIVAPGQTCYYSGPPL